MTKGRSLLAAVPAEAWLCLGVWLVAAAFLWLASARGGPTPGFTRAHAASVEEAHSSPVAAPDIVKFGQIAAGGRAQRTFSLVNDSGSAIEIATTRVSCDCVSIDLANCKIGSREVITARATIDLSDEPDFSGGLCPEAEFLDAHGTPLFVRLLEANVISGAESSD